MFPTIPGSEVPVPQCQSGVCPSLCMWTPSISEHQVMHGSQLREVKVACVRVCVRVCMYIYTTHVYVYINIHMHAGRKPHNRSTGESPFSINTSRVHFLVQHYSSQTNLQFRHFYVFDSLILSQGQGSSVGIYYQLVSRWCGTKMNSTQTALALRTF